MPDKMTNSIDDQMNPVADEKLTDSDSILSHIRALVDGCEEYMDSKSEDRRTALEYYDGIMKDMPSQPGRTAQVSNDIRAMVKKLMPSIIRSILSNDKIVEYAPVGQEDVQYAEQASDYVNHVIYKKPGIKEAIKDSIFDALLFKTGILKWVAYKDNKSTLREITDISQQEMQMLEQSDDVNIIEVIPKEGIQGAPMFDVAFRQTEDSYNICLECIPRDEFLIQPGATSIEDASIVGERSLITRSDLVEMGYDQEAVYSLTYSGLNWSYTNDNIQRIGSDWTEHDIERTKALETVVVFDVYVKLDLDQDGVAETHHIVFGDGDDSRERRSHVLLLHEEVASAPYAPVVIERDAHSFEGHSIYEDIRDLQRMKTVLLRQTADNLYLQNNPIPAIDPSKFEDAEQLIDPEFGVPIRLIEDADVNAALQWNIVPFVAEKTFAMLPYIDDMIKDRTGITDMSGGLNAESFVNMSATSAQIMSESGIAQSDMIIRNISDGLRRAFRGLLELVVMHHDDVRQIQIRGENVVMNPRYWDSNMDVTVNVGLGAGSRERDMNVLQVILSLQEKILMVQGMNSPFVKPEQLYETLSRMVEAAGMPSADPYFSNPTPEEMQEMAEQAQEAENSEKEEAREKIKLAREETQGRLAIEEAQKEADLLVKEKDRQATIQIESLKIEADERKYLANLELQRKIHEDKMAIEAEKIRIEEQRIIQEKINKAVEMEQMKEEQKQMKFDLKKSGAK